MSTLRVVVVAKRTAYQRFIEEERDPRAQLLLKRRSRAVGNWLDAHREHTRTLDEVQKVLARAGAQVMLVKRAHAAFDASDAALVIAVGGDGTLLAASHNVSEAPILGVNSAPRHSVGFFCALNRTTFARGLTQALDSKLPSVELTRMSVLVNGRLRSNRILNDALYAHRSPAATSRYTIEYRRAREEQRSSGFWIGPAAGSTAAQSSAGGRVLPLGSDKLQLVVREPYVPSGERYRFVRLLVGPRENLRVESKMDDACVFLDGPHRQVEVQLGDVLTFRVSDEPLLLLGIRERRAG
jgi:NAD+ kinase